LYDTINAHAAPAQNDTTAIEIEELTKRINLIDMTGINDGLGHGPLPVPKAKKVNTLYSTNTRQKKGMINLTGRQRRESTTNPPRAKTMTMHQVSFMMEISTKTTHLKKETAKREINTAINPSTVDIRIIKTTKIERDNRPMNGETGKETVLREIENAEGVPHREVAPKLPNRVEINSRLFQTKSARPKDQRSHSHLRGCKDSNNLKEKDSSHRHLPHRLQECRSR